MNIDKVRGVPAATGGAQKITFSDNKKIYVTDNSGAQIEMYQGMLTQAILDAHANDASKHVTPTDKTNWNGKADKTYLDSELAKKASATEVVAARTDGHGVVHADLATRVNLNYVTLKDTAVPTDNYRLYVQNGRIVIEKV